MMMETTSTDACSFKTHLVLMKGITWSRDSHGLFDYESRHLTKKTMKTPGPVQIIRNANELELHPLPLATPLALNPNVDCKPLLNIVNDQDQFFLECCVQPQSKVESRELNEQMFLVVRSLKHNNAKIEYDIQQGDILKVGRVKFAVKEVRETSSMDIDTKKKEPSDDDFEEYEEVVSIMRWVDESLPEEEQKKCRFCW
jgi:hypothetical protein